MKRTPSAPRWLKLAPVILAALLACGCFAQAHAPAGRPAPADSPTAVVSSTPSAPPPVSVEPCSTPAVDFQGADLTGRDAPALESLLCGWGFGYYEPDGAWTDEDAYSLALFQRWAGVPPTGRADGATRGALQAAYAQYADLTIPRERLPLEDRYIGVNAGHQQKANYAKEPLSPEPDSPKKTKVSAGTAGIATGVAEYEVNLAVALLLRDRLEALGARVLMARTTNDVDISNVERAKRMNEAGVDLYLSLHCDGNKSKKTSGLHTLVPGERGYQTGDVLLRSQAFAAIMQAEEIRATGATDRGLSVRKDLSSLNWAKMPTCLIEMGYMTNAAEDRKLNSAAYQSKLVDGMAAAFVRYFDEVE